MGVYPQASPRTRLLLLALAAAVALVATGTSGAVRKPLRPKAQPHVPGELIVRFASDVDTGAERAAVARQHAASVARALPVAGLAVVEVDANRPIEQAAAELAQDPDVVYA